MSQMNPVHKIASSFYDIRFSTVMCVNYKMSFGLDDWIYCTLYMHTVRDYRQYSAIADLHNLQFTAAHALGFLVFTSRIQATDLSQSVTLNHKWSLHCAAKFPFLPLLCDCQFQRLDSIQFLSSKVRIPAGCRLEARPFFSDSTITILYSLVLSFSRVLLCSFITPTHGPHEKHSCTVKGACLLVRYLAMDVLLSRARVLWECV
jgi:hypothetical protein